MNFTDKERLTIVQALMYIDSRLNLLPNDVELVQNLLKRFREEK